MIKCCLKCPVHTSICHAFCKQYKEELAQHKAEKEEIDRKRRIDANIVEQTIYRINWQEKEKRSHERKR